jgi:hypothetical protein
LDFWRPFLQQNTKTSSPPAFCAIQTFRFKSFLHVDPPVSECFIFTPPPLPSSCLSRAGIIPPSPPAECRQHPVPVAPFSSLARSHACHRSLRAPPPASQIPVRNKPRHVRAWRVSSRVVDGARVRARVCGHRLGRVRRVCDEYVESRQCRCVAGWAC